MHKNILGSVIPIDEPVTVTHVEPFHSASYFGSHNFDDLLWWRLFSLLNFFFGVVGGLLVFDYLRCSGFVLSS